MKVSGQFQVEMQPLPPHSPGLDGIQMGRYGIRKTYQGDLAATSSGEMLGVRTQVLGSAGYVAIEQVTGNLMGWSGSFVLQHFGTMDQGSDRLFVEIVPDSGTGGLTGIQGVMAIDLEDGRHTYELDFKLP